ncbi:transcription factor HES-5-like [Betta splendens]|uniref:Transcription factor HES-5-like n=1 Tax=Betta splendens TaxID=158456 RepID=A0A6P7KTG6_BETSP|nr:transcription factor HES-5-like [Betta splendens]
MKISQESVDARSDRKLTKSQVEKRRRERLNRSVERLRAMLLQEPQMGGTHHRVEKAEVLERTVLFLQGAAGGAAGGGGGQKRCFQDGFSSCLQRAAGFLGPEGKGLWLGAALDLSFAARFATSDSEGAGSWGRTEGRGTSSSPWNTKLILQTLRQKSKHGQRPQAPASVRSFQVPDQQGSAPGQAVKQNPSQSHPASHPLWRPWP